MFFLANLILETPVFTVGHSTHSLERFVELLEQNNIDILVDVRSAPYSRHVPHFNKEALRVRLMQHSIKYTHMPQEFGARHTDSGLLDAEQRVDFDRVRESDPFRAGIERIINGARAEHRIALMCSEGDPFDCHRFSMISYQLVKEGVRVQHILRHGDIVDNSDLEERLRAQYCRVTTQSELFEPPKSEAAQTEEAYRLRGKEVAYSRGEAFI